MGRVMPTFSIDAASPRRGLGQIVTAAAFDQHGWEVDCFMSAAVKSYSD